MLVSIAGSRLAVETGVGVPGGVELAAGLGHDPAPRRAIDGQDGPAVAVLVAELDQQRLAVVLDAEPVGRVALLEERARGVLARVGDARRPATLRA